MQTVQRYPSFMRLAALLLIPVALSAADSLPNRAPLAPNAFQTLRLTTVKPRGWLLNQLKLQAAGLSGHLDEFWPDLGPNSGWLGGSGESWERGPYFLDGLVPLAFLTDNPVLIAKVKKWLNWTLEHQTPEGWIGPTKNQDWWPNFVMLKVLTQYQEASGDARVIPLMTKYFTYQAAHLDERPLKEWAVYRWQDEVLSIIWLYNRTGDRGLLDLARKLHAQGKDWNAQSAHFPFKEKVSGADANLDSHGVNNAQALKAAAVWSLITKDDSDRAAVNRMFHVLDQYHGLPNGMFSADEHFAGQDPSQGTELCTVVEAMFSLETDLAITGEPAFADRLEKIAYNALPSTITEDFWAHQYDQQPNQVMCSLSKRNWSSNGPESNLFGLEPNFGCCTANMHQGWPKLAASLWMALPEPGLAALVYAPSEVNTTVAGTPLTIEEQTDYPFRETVHFIVRPAHPLAFSLKLRVPAWANAVSVLLNGVEQPSPKSGAFLAINRTWEAGDTVTLHLPMPVRASHWFHNSIVIERGPLVFSLKIGQSWRQEKQTGRSKDWEVFPTTPWNYALLLDPAHPAAAFKVVETPLKTQPFTFDAPPVTLITEGRRVPSWQLEDDSAGSLPLSPVRCKKSPCPQEPELLRLIPYGAAKLRITAFPYEGDN
jgi:hypothetical protein